MTAHGNQIDWSVVRQKLQASQRALEQTMSFDPEQLDALFQKRARKLRERHLDKDVDIAATTVLVFAEGPEKYAIDLNQIAEVSPLPPFTPLPEAAPEVLGLVNLRGEFLTVVAIDRLLGIERKKEADDGYLLVLRRDDTRLGLRVDAVDQIQSLRLDNMSPPPRAADRATDAAKHIKGVSADDTLIVIDGPTIIARFVDKGDS